MKDVKINNLIGLRIKTAREKIGMSQADLAEALGYESATAVSLIESGERKVKAEDLRVISAKLHCDISYLMGQDDRSPDLRVALRADKDLTTEDKEAVMHFINMAKKRHGK